MGNDALLLFAEEGGDFFFLSVDAAVEAALGRRRGRRARVTERWQSHLSLSFLLVCTLEHSFELAPFHFEGDILLAIHTVLRGSTRNIPLMREFCGYD